MVGPFIFFDHMGPVDLPPHIPRTTDVRPHPHIGLSTVTYLFDGEMMHRDSTGAQQAIRPGAVNWMTAGSGISHSERFDGPMRDSGGRMHGIQAWVALPETLEEAEPSFVHHAAEELPVFGESGVSARLIAGQAFGLSNPVRTPVAPLLPSCRVAVRRADRSPRRIRGAGRLCGDGSGRSGWAGYRPGQMLVFAGDADPVMTALEASTVMLLGGEPLGPRHIWWNFVSSRKEQNRASQGGLAERSHPSAPER